MKVCFSPSLAIAVLAMAIHASPAAAGIIINADSVTASAAGAFVSSIDNVIDGSGLSAAVTDANFATVSHDLGFVNSIQWVTNGPNTVNNITFTFNSPVTLDQVLLWNYTQNGSNITRGIDTFDIQVDTGGGFGGTVFSADIVQANYVAGSHFAQVLDIGTQSNIVGLRFSNVTNLGHPSSIGLDEVVFRLAVPEPSSFALCALLGIVGCSLRRRQGTSA